MTTPRSQPTNATPGAPSCSPGSVEQPQLGPDLVLREARELLKFYQTHVPPKPYTAGVLADCIDTIERLNAVAATPGEPVAYLYEVDMGNGYWSQKYTDAKPAGNRWQRNIRPLYLGAAQATRDVPFMAQEILDFLNSIEGAGYGGMASFEIVRGYAKDLALSSTNRGGPDA